jgi:integrase
MANKKVSLIRLCKTDAGWKRLPIVIGKNGKIRPGYALVNGEPVLFPEGHYELRMYEGKRTVYRNVGEDAAEALAAQQKHTHLLLAKDSADSAGVQIVGEVAGRQSLSKKKDEYIQRHLAKGQVRASETATIAIDDFLEATRLIYADQITEASVLTFYTFLRKRGNQDRTIYNKHVSLFGWFKWMGLDTRKLAEKPPSYTEREVEIFHQEDLKVLLDSCTGYQRIVFETLLKTGVRMQEGMHLEWTNVDFRAKKIRVRERLDNDTADDVRIKDRAERSVPLPDDLALALKQWKKDRPNTHLVLGTANDTPNWKWLLMLKRAVRKAGLNCGRCKGCKGKTKECHLWKIHQFRATYTTMLLRSGVDVRTVMSYTGHADMATVMRYLTPADGDHTQSKINAISWTA